MTHQFTTLPNGLRVILIPMKEVGSATTLVLVGAGSRYETKENNGISHFLEHMAFKGTRKRPTAREIATLMDSLGAESNAFTGKELTGYYIKSAANHVPTALDIISDILSNSLLDQQEIDRERGVIIEEINLYEDTPMRKIPDIFERLLYGDTPMGWDIAGEKDIINKIQRDDFVSYMKELYSANNMVIVVAGNIDEKQTLSQIEESFSSYPEFKTAEFVKDSESQSGPQVTLKHKETEQAHFCLGVRTVGLLNEEDRFPLSILGAVLGGGMSSRLFHEVRERRGLAYYVRTLNENYIDRGYISTFSGVDPKRIDDAIKVVVEEYEKIKEKGEIKEEEIRKSKEFIKGHFVLDLEDTKSVAALYGSTQLLENKIENPEDVIEKIEKVTLEEVNMIAEKYLIKNELNLAIIGNFRDQDHFRELLK